MKKRIVLLFVLCMLLIPHTASANSPAPDPLSVKITCKNVEDGTVMLAMFAGDDGVFHPDTVYGPCTVHNNANQYFRHDQADTQLYLKVTLPDGTVVCSDVLPVTPDGVYRYNGKTNELKDITGSLDASSFGYVLLFLGVGIGTMLLALALTLLIEFLTGLCFKMKPYRYIFLANLITNPAMNVVLLFLTLLFGGEGAAYWIALAVLEALVVFIEIAFYRKKYRGAHRLRRIVLFAIVANALSCAVGIALNLLLF